MPRGYKIAEDIEPFIRHMAVTVTVRGSCNPPTRPAKPPKRVALDNLASTDGNGDFYHDDGDWWPLGPDRSWAEAAACAPHCNGGQDLTSLFFPDKDSPHLWRHHLAAACAKEWCDSCPVAEECYDYAKSVHAREGMWGGVDFGLEHYERALRAQEKAAKKAREAR